MPVEPGLAGAFHWQSRTHPRRRARDLRPHSTVGTIATSGGNSETLRLGRKEWRLPIRQLDATTWMPITLWEAMVRCDPVAMLTPKQHRTAITHYHYTRTCRETQWAISGELAPPRPRSNRRQGNGALCRRRCLVTASAYCMSSSAQVLHMPMSGSFIHLAWPSAKAKLLPSLWAWRAGS